VIGREGIVGMGLLRRFEILQGFVVFEIVEVIEALASRSIIAGPRWSP
jgi:hypothetical protein